MNALVNIKLTSTGHVINFTRHEAEDFEYNKDIVEFKGNAIKLKQDIHLKNPVEIIADDTYSYSKATINKDILTDYKQIASIKGEISKATSRSTERVESGNLPCLGNSGMTKIVGDVDDAWHVHTLPFNYVYNGVSTNKLHISTNMAFGFGAERVDLGISQRDGRSYAIYALDSLDKTIIRFEGKTVYNGSGEIQYELTIHPSGVMQLNMGDTPRNGADSFNTLGGTSSVAWHPNKTYVLYPGADGKNWTVHNESHIIYFETKLLIENNDKKFIMAENELIDISEQVSAIDATTVFTNGYSGRSINIVNPTLLDLTKDIYIHCSSEGESIRPGDIDIKLLPKPQLIKHKKDLILIEGINNINSIVDTEEGDIIKAAISKNSGLSWQYFENNSLVTRELSVDNLKESGSNLVDLNSIPKSMWDEYLLGELKIRLAMLTDVNSNNNTTTMKKVRIDFVGSTEIEFG